MPCLQDALRREEYSKQGFMIAPSQGLEADGARRLWNESFFSAPQLKRDPLGCTTRLGAWRSPPQKIRCGVPKRDWDSVSLGPFGRGSFERMAEEFERPAMGGSSFLFK